MILDCGHTSTTSTVTDNVACALCDERQIPTSTRLGRRTPSFTADSTPAALRKAHRTNAWAQLVVAAGSVIFVEDDTHWQSIATPGDPVTIVPRRDHHITPSADAEFHVQFYDLPEVD